jgi:predicted TIM-barrel fold metal-dependent hydrolase
MDQTRQHWRREIFNVMTHALVAAASVTPLAVTTIVEAQQAPVTAAGPLADHHQHLPSPAAIALLNRVQPNALARNPRTAEELVVRLDEAGIGRAVLLSNAYWFGGGVMPKAEGDEYTNVRAENDRTATQAARFLNRLIAFCSVNPLKDYAVREIARCAQGGRFKGLKLHFGNSRVDILNDEHVDKLRRVFSAANERHLPIVVHLWTGRNYGREHAEIFLKRILPTAPDVVVQIAHFAGGGPGYTESALAVYAEAIAAGNPSARNLYFDIATVANGQPPEVLQMFATRMRQVGLHRILYGTDVGPPREGWTTLSTTVPLNEEEISTIGRNLAPYLR